MQAISPSPPSALSSPSAISPLGCRWPYPTVAVYGSSAASIARSNPPRVGRPPRGKAARWTPRTASTDPIPVGILDRQQPEEECRDEDDGAVHVAVLAESRQRQECGEGDRLAPHHRLDAAAREG